MYGPNNPASGLTAADYTDVDDATDVNFSYTGDSSISGSVWHDQTQNDTEDATDTPFAGQLVELIDETTGQIIASTITDANGDYEFLNLLPGTYALRITPPIGFNESFDVDGLGNSNYIGGIVLGISQSIPGQDFAYVQGTLSDTGETLVKFVSIIGATLASAAYLLSRSSAQVSEKAVVSKRTSSGFHEL